MAVQQGHDLVHQIQLLLLLLGLRQCRQGDLTELAQVTGQALGGFRRVERLQLMQPRLLGSQQLMERLTEGLTLETGGSVQGIHTGTPSRSRQTDQSERSQPVAMLCGSG